MSKQSESLFVQLGGEKSVEAVVTEFYKRVLADKELAPFFSKTNMKWLHMRQVQFFTQALGGPTIYKGKDMKAAHAKMQIADQHFQKVAQHLVETLKSFRVSESHIDQVVRLVTPLKADIVNTAQAKAAAPQRK